MLNMFMYSNILRLIKDETKECKKGGAISGVGFPSGVTLVPERPIGSPWLYSPNLTAVNAYICPGNSVVVSLAIVNGSGNNNSPAYDGVPNWPSTIAAVQANCSGGIVLPGFFYNSSQDTCKNLGYGDSASYTSRNYTGSDLRDFSQNFTFRQALLTSMPPDSQPSKIEQWFTLS